LIMRGDTSGYLSWCRSRWLISSMIFGLLSRSGKDLPRVNSNFEAAVSHRGELDV
jgi:hypothetical protein